MIRTLLAATALCCTMPALAKTIAVEAGADAQERLQEALILAEPGDVVELGAGRFELTDGLSLDVDNVVVRGAGMDKSILSFAGQLGAGEGLLVTSDDVVLRDFAVEDSKGDGIKSKGADRIVYHAIRVEWTGGPKASNGAYGIYPVEASDVLVQDSVVRGASDAGIYVGQSKNIIVRRNTAIENVAGIEIENSFDAEVTENLVTGNTGGILVFDLPNLPQMGGHNVLVARNAIIDNNTDNFAPEGNIVASVPAGTGVMVMANRNVQVVENAMINNGTTNVMVVAYTQSFDDANYDPTPREVYIAGNVYGRAGFAPDFEGGKQLAAAFGGALPGIVYDGLGRDLIVNDAVPVLSLGLTKVGQSPTEAQPSLYKQDGAGETVALSPIVLPASMEAALK
ncbi:parallel beta-helix domain-containing protein [Parasphingorhabdus cellanae]|uniref:Right-handed parallel beta-helix repeat-containing protein n=1 Tax=Parasphingorhabdus cellanae TaxID=2806553 RepID=A0ABX7T7J4_9SPHN|nr:parallel beta-helix domain-containing protein [Parasphingorhabdus cellanae]QTD57580.1 right-handed parallel beta-helix repeat-containing protein [Parasphingorhabdus cellanae]